MALLPSQKTETVDERRHDCDDEEIDDESFGRAELRGDESEPATINAPIMPPATTSSFEP
jgi:hypothetical protein